MNKVHINTLIDRTVEAMLSIGIKPYTIYGPFYGRLDIIRKYHFSHGTEYFDSDLLKAFFEEAELKYSRREISRSYYCVTRLCVERLMEVYETGKLKWHMHKPQEKYRLSEPDADLLNEFLLSLTRHENTKHDYSWVIRRYLYCLRSNGMKEISEIKTTDIASFILSCSKELCSGSLRNVLSYTRKFHEFLRDTGRLDIPFEGLFSVSVIRKNRIQQPTTTDELNRILAQIDLSSAKGKRDYAIILLGSELGLRAVDICNLKLCDIDWLKNEIHITQKKTNYPVKLPMTERTASILRDYIMTSRSSVKCEYVFLKCTPPHQKITDPSTIGDMFAKYQSDAGIKHSAFDGKGFHSLRRRLGKELVVEGVPVTTVSQILGHRNLDSAKQYISLDSIHLKECALDFSAIGGKGNE